MKHTEKKRYPDEQAAIKSALRSSRMAGRPIRIYHCDECGGWHLTKKKRWFRASKRVSRS